MNIELTEKEIGFLKQYANVFRQERDFDCTADPIVMVEDIEELRSGNGISLEELDYGNDITSVFCKWIESQ